MTAVEFAMSVSRPDLVLQRLGDAQRTPPQTANYRAVHSEKYGKKQLTSRCLLIGLHGVMTARRSEMSISCATAITLTVYANGNGTRWLITSLHLMIHKETCHERYQPGTR